MRKHTHIEWTLERAATEFGINPRTLRARITQSGVAPEFDGKWTTQQIVHAIYNDLESERIRLTRAQADQVEMENAEKNGTLVEIEALKAKWAPLIVGCVRVIRSSKLDPAAQDEILNNLAKFFG